MHRLRILFFLFFVFALSGSASIVWTAENIEMVHLKDSTKYLCNPDQLISAEVQHAIDAKLRKLERVKGVESVVVVAKRVANGDCYQFAMNLGNKYGVGDKHQQTGLIIVISTEDRGYYILTGKGLESALPDAICRRIENRYMVPALKRGQWDEALVGTVDGIEQYLSGNKELVKTRNTSNESAGQLSGLLVALLIVFVVIIVLRNKKPSKCPQCGKARLKETHRQKIKTPSGKNRIRITLQCPHCGYTQIKDVDDNDNNGGIGRAVPPFIFFGGNGNRGGFGGGGIGGGSFGGGSFGGGGSGGRF